MYISKPCLVCGGISTPNAQLRGNTFTGITFLLLPNSTTGVSNTTQFLAASPQFLPASPGVRSERQPGTLAPIQVTHGSPQASGTPQMVQAFFKEALFSSLMNFSWPGMKTCIKEKKFQPVYHVYDLICQGKHRMICIFSVDPTSSCYSLLIFLWVGSWHLDTFRTLADIIQEF